MELRDEDILGISRRLNKPPSAEPLPPEPPVLEEEGMIKVPKKDLKRAQGILKGILAGRKVRVTGATWEEVHFEVPEVQAGDTNCELCQQSFRSTRSLCCHMKTHTGDTGWSCDRCGKVLASRAMSELHQKGCGQEKGHRCQVCKKGYTTKQALVAHLKVKHGPAPTVEQLTCPTCSKVFKLVKTMCKHMASHKGPSFAEWKGVVLDHSHYQNTSTGTWRRGTASLQGKSNYLSYFVDEVTWSLNCSFNYLAMVT